ncbi:Probably inactive leucine-rich repeat receptor-like protein kinase IMK2, partial [Linum perenne]
LDHNLICGNIPYSLSNLGLFQEISLDHKQISGTIPNELGSLSSLRKLDLSSNSINGTIPSSFPNLHNLTALNVQNNNLHGSNLNKLTKPKFPFSVTSSKLVSMVLTGINVLARAAVAPKSFCGAEGGGTGQIWFRER